MTKTVNIILYKAWILYSVYCSVIKCAFGIILPAPKKPLVPKIMTPLSVSPFLSFFFLMLQNTYMCKYAGKGSWKMSCTWTSVKIPGDDVRWSEGPELEHLPVSDPTGFEACVCSHSSLGFCPCTSRLWWAICKQDFCRKSMDEHPRSFLPFSWKKLFGFFPGQNCVKGSVHFVYKTTDSHSHKKRVSQDTGTS